VLEPALDAIDREGSELFPFGNNFMKFALLLLLAGIWILGIFYPRVASLLACIPWALIWFVQATEASAIKTLLGSDEARSEADSMFTNEEKRILPRYAFFFKSPFVSAGISDAGSLWAFSTLPWSALLLWGNLWQFLACPAFVLVAVLQLGPKMNPLLFLGESAKRNSLSPSSSNATKVKILRGLLRTPTKEVYEFGIFAQLCSKMFSAGHPIRQYVEDTKCMIWPNNRDSATRSTRQKKTESRFLEDCPVQTEAELLEKNIQGLSVMLLECLRDRAELICRAVNREPVDAKTAAKASRELLRLSNKVRSLLNTTIGNFDPDESDEEIKSARTANELADLAYMRFFTAIGVLKLNCKKDLADEIDRQIEEITGERNPKTNKARPENEQARQTARDILEHEANLLKRNKLKPADSFAVAVFSPLVLFGRTRGKSMTGSGLSEWQKYTSDLALFELGCLTLACCDFWLFCNAENTRAVIMRILHAKFSNIFQKPAGLSDIEISNIINDRMATYGTLLASRKLGKTIHLHLGFALHNTVSEGKLTLGAAEKFKISDSVAGVFAELEAIEWDGKYLPDTINLLKITSSRMKDK